QSMLDRYPSVLITAGTLYQYDPKAIEELKKLDAQIAGMRSKKPVEEFIRAASENPGEMPDTFLFFRGEHTQPRHKVEPGDLMVCVAEGASPNLPADDPKLPTTGRRLAYARRLTSGQHPLFGRVIVNRVWLHHFGRGIVGTPGDFG